jgi:hypothetical protein
VYNGERSRTKTGKNYAWNADEQPPQALHLDIGQTHAGRFIDPAARLWKKGVTNRVNGLQLRLIPCLGSNQLIALSDNQRGNVKLMAAKQQYLTNSYSVKLENAYIMNLDAKVKNMTLRKYLMSRAPKTSVIQRLFVSADKSWKGNTFTLVTVKTVCSRSSQGTQPSEEAFMWVLTAPFFLFKDSVLFSTESDNLITNPAIIRRIGHK